MGTPPSLPNMPPPSPLRACELSGAQTALLDALPASVALLDHDGSVLFVNRAWSDFSSGNGGLDRTQAIGVSFVDAGFWASHDDAPCDDVARACAGIRAVLNGDINSFVLDYQCHTPIREHWLELRVAPVLLDGGVGAVLMQTSITERKRAADRAWRRANFDALTDLPNRSLLSDRLTQAMALARRQEGMGAVLLVDIERLREVNDRLGHEAGDALLQQVAARLRHNVRRSDTVARIGEDEFAILAPRIDDWGALQVLHDKLARALGEPYQWARGPLRAFANIGVCAFPGSGVETAAQVIETAAEALAKSKRDAQSG